MLGCCLDRIEPRTTFRLVFDGYADLLRRRGTED